MIIQEVDGIDNYLVPLLRRDMIRQGPRKAVQISDKMCDFDDNFKLLGPRVTQSFQKITLTPYS